MSYFVTVGKKPVSVIKKYTVKIETYTTYDLHIWHNETKNTIKMSNNGISINSFNGSIDLVIETFEKQTGFKNVKYCDSANW